MIYRNKIFSVKVSYRTIQTCRTGADRPSRREQTKMGAAGAGAGVGEALRRLRQHRLGPHEVVEVRDEDGLVAAVEGGPLDAPVLPVRPVDVAGEKGEAERVGQVVVDHDRALGAVNVAHLDPVHLGVAPVELLGGGVEGDAVRPDELAVDDDLPAVAVQPGALYPGVAAPVGPEHPALARWWTIQNWTM
jgi:hypothetical protein